MPQPIPDSTLDEILALQLTVAWAGEGACEPRRLGWWNTDLIDPDGGGDLLQRLLPKTHAWASLQAVREAARRVDEKARQGLPDPDKARTLFFLGFELDEKLDERLAHHKRSGGLPDSVLSFPVVLGAAFSRDEVAEALRPSANSGEHTVVPGGRQMKGVAPESLALLVKNLTAALVPFTDKYPMPFYRVK